jgi:hypothetical protein
MRFDGRGASRRQAAARPGCGGTTRGSLNSETAELKRPASAIRWSAALAVRDVRMMRARKRCAVLSSTAMKPATRIGQSFSRPQAAAVDVVQLIRYALLYCERPARFIICTYPERFLQNPLKIRDDLTSLSPRLATSAISTSKLWEERNKTIVSAILMLIFMDQK